MATTSDPFSGFLVFSLAMAIIIFATIMYYAEKVGKLSTA
jgi:hypothetical protein